jgi:hypothetical protein
MILNSILSGIIKSFKTRMFPFITLSVIDILSAELHWFYTVLLAMWSGSDQIASMPPLTVVHNYKAEILLKSHLSHHFFYLCPPLCLTLESTVVDICTTSFNFKKLFVLSTYMFHVVLRTNSDYFPKLH